WCAVILPGQPRDDGLAGIALKAGGERQRGRLPGFGVREYLCSVHAIERERGTVDVLRAETGLAVRRIDAPLHQPERRAWRQIVDNDDSGSLTLDTDRGKSAQLAPDPAAMIGRRDACRRRRKERRPFTRRTAPVIGGRGAGPK